MVIKKIKEFIIQHMETVKDLMSVLFGALLAIDLIAGTIIPLAYGQGSEKFAFINLVLDLTVMAFVIEYLNTVKNEDSH